MVGVRKMIAQFASLDPCEVKGKGIDNSQQFIDVF